MSKLTVLQKKFVQLELDLTAALDNVRDLQTHFSRYVMDDHTSSPTSTSHTPENTGLKPLLENVPLRDQLRYTPKSEPEGGAHADRLVNAARNESIVDRSDVDQDECDE